ncbi:MAG: lipid A deacylase LpxR family protein [Desulfobulbaceae bacterium]|nr:lipid A deacylase LpxR family protein [Desulfobulbaceae bacterium]
MIRSILTWLVVAGCIVQGGNVASAAENKDNTFIFYWENDTFSNSDRYYTNGLKLLWASGPLTSFSEDKRLPAWSGRSFEAMPVINSPSTSKHIALSLGQKIYTPRDLENPNLIKDDRPYAGWTYAGIALHSKSDGVLDTFEIDLGMIGPDSYARDVQVKIHDWVDSKEPQGWEHQLKNEVGVVLVYERKWRFAPLGPEGMDFFDFITHAGVTLGNVHTYSNAGGEIRFGFNLPDDFGTALIRPAGDASIPVTGAEGGDTGFHLFVAVDGRAIGRNIFLDGNTFTESHDVDKKYFVADIMAGISVHLNGVKLTYSHVYKTKEFDAQKEEQIFGSVSLSFVF